VQKNIRDSLRSEAAEPRAGGLFRRAAPEDER